MSEPTIDGWGFTPFTGEPSDPLHPSEGCSEFVIFDNETGNYFEGYLFVEHHDKPTRIYWTEPGDDCLRMDEAIFDNYFDALGRKHWIEDKCPKHKDQLEVMVNCFICQPFRPEQRKIIFKEIE